MISWLAVGNLYATSFPANDREHEVLLGSWRQWKYGKDRGISRTSDFIFPGQSAGNSVKTRTVGTPFSESIQIYFLIVSLSVVFLCV